MTTRPYAVIIRDTDYRAHRHYSLEAAREEARRLARQSPGNRFVLLVSREAFGCEIVELPKETLRVPAKEVPPDDDDIPF